MTKQEREILDIIASVLFGEILVKKESGKIVIIKKTESIKLSN